MINVSNVNIGTKPREADDISDEQTTLWIMLRFSLNITTVTLGKDDFYHSLPNKVSSGGNNPCVKNSADKITRFKPPYASKPPSQKILTF
jgi:hypothetical protein